MPPAAANDPIKEKLPSQDSDSPNKYKQRFREFDLAGKVYIVTGGAQGLGLSLAEALVEAGSSGRFTCSKPRNSAHASISQFTASTAVILPMRNSRLPALEQTQIMADPSTTLVRSYGPFTSLLRRHSRLRFSPIYNPYPSKAHSIALMLTPEPRQNAMSATPNNSTPLPLKLRLKNSA